MTIIATDILKNKWKELLEHKDLPSIRDSYRKGEVAKLLENQVRDLEEQKAMGFALNEAAPANSSGAFPNATNLKGYDPVLISLVRRAMPNLVAFDVCGVQAMSAPTGLIFAMKSRYTAQGGTEALFNEADTDFSGTGTHAGSDPMDPSSTNGIGLSTAAGEALGDGVGADFAQMAFSIDKVTVTAKTRALKAEYSMEIQQDLKAVHGLDAETELANILAAEILAEINREVLRTIYTNAQAGAQTLTTTAGIFDLDTDSNGRWLVEKFKGLMFQIEREANKIAKDTRRGKGNIIITSSDVASALTMAGLLDIGTNLKDNLNVDDTGNTYVGVLNGRYKVFVDPYVPQSSTNYFVVGYKGSSAYDAGLFYCPYVPLQMVRAVDPRSFQPRIGFKTRYGLVSNPFANSAGDGSLTAASNIYYRKVRVDNLQ